MENTCVLLTMGDTGFEIPGDAVGLLNDGRGVSGGKGFIGGFLEEGQPALKVVRVEGQL